MTSSFQPSVPAHDRPDDGDVGGVWRVALLVATTSAVCFVGLMAHVQLFLPLLFSLFITSSDSMVPALYLGAPLVIAPIYLWVQWRGPLGARRALGAVLALVVIVGGSGFGVVYAHMMSRHDRLTALDQAWFEQAERVAIPGQSCAQDILRLNVVRARYTLKTGGAWARSLSWEQRLVDQGCLTSQQAAERVRALLSSDPPSSSGIVVPEKPVVAYQRACHGGSVVMCPLGSERRAWRRVEDTLARWDMVAR